MDALRYLLGAMRGHWTKFASAARWVLLLASPAFAIVLTLLGIKMIPWLWLGVIWLICALFVMLIGLVAKGVEQGVQIVELQERLRTRVFACLDLIGETALDSAGRTTTTIWVRLKLEATGTENHSDVLAIVTSIKANDSRSFVWRVPSTALWTEANHQRNGGGPFNLRAGQIKIVPICSRPVDATDKEKGIDFALPEFRTNEGGTLCKTNDCTVEIRITGIGQPLVLNLHLLVDSTGQLSATMIEIPYVAPGDQTTATVQ